jgi:nucleoside 2-deoxyribosyltransferase
VIYLASPYSHPDESVRISRFHAACDAAASLMRAGHVVFSPIAHTHPIAVRNALPLGWEFWKATDEAFLSRCDELYVLMLEGWDTSKGVTAEIEIARALGHPVKFI